MRLHQPTGIWLLFWPCVWGLAMGAHRIISLDFARDVILFFIGAVVMRSAGCIVNDMWDRKLDAQVARTKARPLASGEVPFRTAILLLILLLLMGALILTQLSWLTRFLAIIALALVLAYPAMKRITWWPQAFLGVTFNFGVLMGYAATSGTLTPVALMIYLGALFWTIGYDTIYAHQDIEDDRNVGIKSTALKFAAAPRRFVALNYALAAFLWWCAGLLAAWPLTYFAALLLPTAHLAWQLVEWKPKDPTNCLKLFKRNVITAALLAAAFLLARIY